MSDIYEQHDKAFALVAAFVVLDATSDRVATIAFKFPQDGAGRLYAYVHWLGLPMVRGFASGFGYDKRTAACAAAERALRLPDGHGTDTPLHEFWNALSKDGGASWESALREAGFTIWQAV